MPHNDLKRLSAELEDAMLVLAKLNSSIVELLGEARPSFLKLSTVLELHLKDPQGQILLFPSHSGETDQSTNEDGPL